MRSKMLAVLGLTCLAGIGDPSPARAAVIDGLPYLCFDAATAAGCGTAESPFAGESYDSFHLETFEDGFNAPGVTRTGGFGTTGGGLTDSVDADDGSVNGSGSSGHSFFGFGTISFTFDPVALGGLPTDVGIVWTDGDGFDGRQVGSNYTFSFFDAGGSLLGSTTQRLGDANNFGGTAEDRFFGWTGSVGVGSLSVAGNSVELDHLQYGFSGAPGAVPEPTTWAMLLVGFGVVGGAMRSRRGPALALG